MNRKTIFLTKHHTNRGRFLRVKNSTINMLIILSLTSIFLFNSISFAFCLSESFEVPALEQVSKKVNIQNGEYVSASFIVSGARNEDHNKVVLFVNDPHGDEIYEYRIEGPEYNGVSSTSFSFKATDSGEYELIFDNTRLRFAENVTVSLDYSVKTLILGLEQELFYMVIVIIVIILVLSVIVFRKRFDKIKH